MNHNLAGMPAWLRALGLFALITLGVLSTLATGGGGGGSGGPASTAGTIQLAAPAFDASEGMIVNIRVARSAGTSGIVRVDYATVDGSAAAGSDYTETNGTLTWQDGVGGNQTISIPIADDAEAEITETFSVVLSNVSAGVLGANASAVVSIVDNDVTALAAFGSITALGSVTLNGVHYDTSSSNVTINGALGIPADLELGHVVAITGEANLSEATGLADTLSYSATIVGPVESIDTALEQLVVMGQTVSADDDTVYDPLIDPSTFAGLAVGDTAQISGFRNADGGVVATRIAPAPATAGVQLIGPVTGLDLANFLFTIDRLTVDYSSAAIVDLPGGVPVEEQYVLVRGALTDGILVVDEIVDATSVTAPASTRVHLGGIVTRFGSASDFDLNGFPVISDSATHLVDGALADLSANAKITIDGEISPGGDAVLARNVLFGAPTGPRATLPIGFANFTRIAVRGFCRITVVRGTGYSIEITAGTDLVDDVRVTQNGDSVSFAPPLANELALYTAVVRLPTLAQLAIEPGSLATVTLSGFSQPQMAVDVDGVSRVHGESLAIGELSASVAGVSLLNFGDVGPLTSANVTIDGVSQATLNMGIGASLTGSVSTGQGTGESRLFYYGTNVTVNVATDAQSIVTRLGDTRP